MFCAPFETVGMKSKLDDPAAVWPPEFIVVLLLLFNFKLPKKLVNGETRFWSEFPISKVLLLPIEVLGVMFVGFEPTAYASAAWGAGGYGSD